MLSIASLFRSTVQFLCVECQQTPKAFFLCLSLKSPALTSDDARQHYFFNSRGLVAMVTGGNWKTWWDKMTHNTLSQVDITAFYSFRLHWCTLCFAYALWCIDNNRALSVRGMNADLNERTMYKILFELKVYVLFMWFEAAIWASGSQAISCPEADHIAGCRFPWR